MASSSQCPRLPWNALPAAVSQRCIRCAWPASTWASRKLPEGAARVALGVDPAALSLHSAAATAGAPGAALVHVAKYLAGGTDAPPPTARNSSSSSTCAIPGWREQVELVRFLPQMTVTAARFRRKAVPP